MKKATVLALILALLLTFSAPAFAFTAKLSSQGLSVDGKTVNCEKYNIDGSNYFKLRDLAALLNGTGSQFNVGYDTEKKVISITTNHAYTTPNDTELVVGEDQSAKAKVSPQTIMINGVERNDLTAYNIGGNNFFQLREMGDALGFDVDYDSATRTMHVISRSAAPSVKLDRIVLSLRVGETGQLIATKVPESATVTWSSGNPAIATVDANGLVKAVGEGKVDIFATAGEVKAFCTVTVSPPSEVVIFSPENLVYKIPYEQLQQHLKWGYSQSWQDMPISASGEYGGAFQNKSAWSRSARSLMIRDVDSSYYAGSYYSSEFSKAPDIYSVFFLLGSSKIHGWALDGRSTVKRVEISDTVSEIEYHAFDDCEITRIGIPASVTKIEESAFNTYTSTSILGSNKDLVIYGEADSYAQSFAKQYGIPFKTATILYDVYDRTVMVTPEERELFRQNGWYAEPVAKLYAADGRTKVVAKNEVAANVAVGWHTYPYYFANQKVQSEGYNAGVAYLEQAINIYPEYVNELTQQKDEILQNWQKAIGCPVAIISQQVGSSYGYPTVEITFRNLTQKQVTRLDVRWTCLNAYGKQTSDYSWRSGIFDGYSEPGYTIEPEKTLSLIWTLYSNKQTASISNYYMTGVAFADGTSWRK